MTHQNRVSIQQFPFLEGDSVNKFFFDPKQLVQKVHFLYFARFSSFYFIEHQFDFRHIKLPVKNTALVSQRSTKKSLLFTFVSVS